MPLDKEQADLIAQIAEGSDVNAPSIWNTAPEAMPEVHSAFSVSTSISAACFDAFERASMSPIG